MLEIGTGWGGLAIHAARHHGCRVTTTTLSHEQARHARAWIEREGLADRITVLEQDYRELEGRFDKLVSIEMIEAVGAGHYAEYFRRCSNLLKADGLMLIQAITISDQRYEASLRNTDFIKRYIFPGGQLPCNAVLAHHVANDTDMQLVGLDDLTHDYALTLNHWRQNFQQSLPQVRRLGFDETFIRMWRYYLCFCEGGSWSAASIQHSSCWQSPTFATCRQVADRADCTAASLRASRLPVTVAPLHHAGGPMQDAIPQLHPYDALTPDAVLTAVESTGVVCDGRLLALNSYENRVYQVGVEDAEPVIAKFYRPARWSRDQILEEHAFTLELQDAGLQVVAPLLDGAGRSLHDCGDFLLAVYPRRGGHAPEPGGSILGLLGRSLGRLHALAATRRFRYRQTLDLEQYGRGSRDFLLEHDFIPAELVPAYESLADTLLERMRQVLAASTRVRIFRLHGDCHVGNLLWRGDNLWFLDFDDCLNGPAVQDLWMLLAGERDQQLRQLSELIEGYSMFHDFNAGELVLIETLRTLRLMHYSAWLARRWSDPAFPRSFPWFNTGRYWSEHILALREQQAALDEAPLVLY